MCGDAGLLDHSSRPVGSPHRTPAHIEDCIEHIRRTAKFGPVQIMGVLAGERIKIAASTVHRILHRRGISRLRDLDPNGHRLRAPHRYERDDLGELVRVDVKKVGRIPDGGGWRVHGRGTAQDRAAQRQIVGYGFIHTVIDDHLWLAYSEELHNETSTTTVGFWTRAAAFFAALGITNIRRCLTDTPASYHTPSPQPWPPPGPSTKGAGHTGRRPTAK